MVRNKDDIRDFEWKKDIQRYKHWEEKWLYLMWMIFREWNFKRYPEFANVDTTGDNYAIWKQLLKIYEDNNDWSLFPVKDKKMLIDYYYNNKTEYLNN